MNSQVYPNKCGVVRKSKGEFECITRGQRSYLSLRLQDRPSERIIVGLGQGRDEAWIRKINAQTETEV